MYDAQAVRDNAQRSPPDSPPITRRPFTLKETQIVEALYVLGMTDDFIAVFLRRTPLTIFGKRQDIGLCRSFEDIRLGTEPLRPKFRMTRRSRALLQMLDGPDSWLCKCLDAFPQFVTNYVVTHHPAVNRTLDRPRARRYAVSVPRRPSCSNRRTPAV
jgi:hypothetical protein